MSKQTVATLILTMLVTNYLSLQAGQTILYYKANAPSRRPVESRVYGVNQVLQFDQTRVDFGQITGSTATSRRVGFVNKGKEPVEIANVRASCACTAAVMVNRIVAPGSRGEMVLTINPALASPELAVSVSVEYKGKTQIDRLLVSGQVSK